MLKKKPSYKQVAKQQADIINKLTAQIAHMKGILLISAEMFGKDTMRAVTEYTQNPSPEQVAVVIAELKKHLLEVEEDGAE